MTQRPSHCIKAPSALTTGMTHKAGMELGPSQCKLMLSAKGLDPKGFSNASTVQPRRRVLVRNGSNTLVKNHWLGGASWAKSHAKKYAAASLKRSPIKDPKLLSRSTSYEKDPCRQPAASHCVLKSTQVPL